MEFGPFTLLATGAPQNSLLSQSMYKLKLSAWRLGVVLTWKDDANWPWAVFEAGYDCNATGPLRLGICFALGGKE
jgi:hypothetical protein